MLLAMIVVGGLDSVAGSILGAAFLTLAQQKLGDNPQTSGTLYGAALVVVLLFLPGGLTGLWLVWGRALRSACSGLYRRAAGRG
jgi:branched-chain amino acid transport system permease protein